MKKIFSIFKSSQKHKELKRVLNEEQMPEPDHILVTCFNNKSGEGGVFLLNGDKLVPIFDNIGCYGSFFKEDKNLLFCITRKEPQIISFRKEGNKFVQIPIHFKNYIFGHDTHGVYVSDDKIYVVSSEGEDGSESATNNDHHLGAKVGKIIVSEIEIDKDVIVIKNSKIFNPFSCYHHHHINDIISVDDSIYLSSFSYCDSQKTYVNKGAISKLNSSNKCEVLIEGISQPHSLYHFDDRVYFCASNMSTVFSVDLLEKNTRIEYKGPNLFIRGLLITRKYFYIGISESVDRTNPIFNNQTAGILRFNRDTGETKLIPIPAGYDNIYSIVSDMRQV